MQKMQAKLRQFGIYKYDPWLGSPYIKKTQQTKE